MQTLRAECFSTATSFSYREGKCKSWLPDSLCDKIDPKRDSMFFGGLRSPRSYWAKGRHRCKMLLEFRFGGCLGESRRDQQTPTDHFTIIEHKNRPVEQFHIAQKRRKTDFETLKTAKRSSGPSRICVWNKLFWQKVTGFLKTGVSFSLYLRAVNKYGLCYFF